MKFWLVGTGTSRSADVLLSAVTKAVLTARPSKFCTYTVLGPELPPEKIAPKSRIRIIGKMRVKKKPSLLLMLPVA